MKYKNNRNVYICSNARCKTENDGLNCNLTKKGTPMIFYGTRGSNVLTEQLDMTTCINCNEQSVALVVYSRYAHVYWIPVFPIGKLTATECINCKQSFTGDAIPASYKEQVDYQKVKASTPILHFAGLMVIVAAIIAGVISSHQNDKTMLASIEAAQPGDTYHVKYDSKEYTLWKVTEVKGDTVYFYPHQYVVNKLSGLDESPFIGKSGYDEAERFGLVKAELKEMLDKGDIRDIVH